MPRPPVDYDAEVRLHNQVLRRTCGVRRHDHVLDVGCGTGQTTREAARTATTGSALGVDPSAPMIDRARELAQADGLCNVTFQRADAQVHHFPPELFDLAISRFGTMFFDDPVAAFANIGRALRPAGRLVMMVWQGHERNEWEVAIRRSLEGFEEPAAVAPAGPDPFSLADPATVEGILDAAGFADVTFTSAQRAPLPIAHQVVRRSAPGDRAFFQCGPGSLAAHAGRIGMPSRPPEGCGQRDASCRPDGR